MNAALSNAIADLLEASARVIRAAALEEQPEASSLSQSSEAVTRNLGKDGSDSPGGGEPSPVDGCDDASGSEQDSADDAPARMSGDRIEASGGERSDPLPETPEPELQPDNDDVQFDPLVNEDAANTWLASLDPVPALLEPGPEPVKAPKPRKERAPKPDNPPVQILGVDYHFSKNVAPLIRALSGEPHTLREICDMGICQTIHGAQIRIAAARIELQQLTGDQFQIHKDDDRYVLAGTKPEETPQPEECPPAVIEQVTLPPEPEPAPVVKQIRRYRPEPAPVAPVVPQLSAGDMKIEPGDVLAVDIKQQVILTPNGPYKTGGTPMARALHKLKDGNLYGLDVIAKSAGWKDAAVARSALQYEQDNLSKFGAVLHLDKFNARLKRAGE